MKRVQIVLSGLFVAFFVCSINSAQASFMEVLNTINATGHKITNAHKKNTMKAHKKSTTKHCKKQKC